MNKYYIGKLKSLASAIRWRMHFVMFEMWNKSPRIILYTLLPWVRQAKHWRELFLKQHGYINWDAQKKVVNVQNLYFKYPCKIPTSNIISIVLGNDPYIKNNFINNTALRQEGPYERAGVQLARGDCVIDAGANIGIFSVVAADKVKEDGHVYAFEPIDMAQSVLKENIELNNLSNVDIVPVALGDSKVPLTFSVEPESLGSSTAVLDNPKASESLEISQTTLDAYVHQNNIQKIDFIKADIEGMERKLLLGAKEVITRDKPKLAVCTYHFPDDPEVLRDIILSFVPDYHVDMSPTKLYAWI